MKALKEFDYNLWTTEEDGVKKYFVGVKATGEVTEVDEVAGIKFKDNDGVQIMKDYMNSGSFVRGKESVIAKASMVFEGNINQSVESLLKTSTLFEPFPEKMIDTAFLDRMHMYIPGWEIPKLRPEFFTDNWGFISDYFAEFLREMRKRSEADCYHKYFKLGRCLNQRDMIRFVCPNCGTVTVSKEKSRRHIQIDMYAPKGEMLQSRIEY